MFGSRRLAKRSIVGTQVAAKWQDGRYYPGVIQSQYAEETPFTDAVYTVLFDDGYEKNIPSKAIIGQGFQQINSAYLKNGQKVFLTLNGREVSATVIKHSLERDEIQVNILTSLGDEIEMIKRLEEIRLMKSRKSARLVDQDTDYSKLADLQLSEAKKRAVSSGIDVPNKQIRHWHSDHVAQNNNDYHSNIVARGDETVAGDDVEMMDENIAAMVLTSLSCSPQSPQYNDLRENLSYTKAIPLSSSASSSGFYSNNSERSDPSPPSSSQLSESAPSSSGMMFGPYTQDEGVQFDEDVMESDEKEHSKITPGNSGMMFGLYTQDEGVQCDEDEMESDEQEHSKSKLSESTPGNSGMMFGPYTQDEGVQFDKDEMESEEKEHSKVQMRTMYKCTWPGCNKICVSCSTIEKHVRNCHLGTQKGSGSEGEEEFYYTEIEVTVEHVTQGLSDMSTEASSPPTDVSPVEPTHHFVIPDHDYQKKDYRNVFASSVPSTSAFINHAQATPIPIKVPEVTRSLSWQNTYTFSSSPSPPIRSSGKLSSQERLQQHQAQSPKIHSNNSSKLTNLHKKPRSEVRKCRKVYGMENREMWCTQCKWKKACTRFLD